MKDTALYEHLLGLQSPWSVKSVDLSLTERRVVVEVILKRRQVRFPRFFVFQEVGFMLPVSLSVE
jgi:hypothetical protein